MSEEKNAANKLPKPTKIRPLTEEQKSICENWKASGISKQQFCYEHKLPTSTFYGWCAKLWSNNKPQHKKLFSPVIPIQPLTKNKIKDKNEGIIKITLPNQAIVKVILPLKELGNLLQELCYATTIIR